MYKVDIYPEHELVVMIYSGIVDFNQIVSSVESILRDASYKPHFCGVVDHRKSTPNISPLENKIIANYVNETNSAKGKWVFLAETSMTTALAEIFVLKDEHMKANKICTTIQFASEFLGIKLGPFLQAGKFD